MSNFVDSYMRGLGNALQQGAAVSEMRDRNALRDLYQQQGAGIARGNPEAINALAALDPMAAMQARSTRQTMDLRQQAAERQAQGFDLEVKKYAASLDAAEAARQAEAIKKGVFAASGAQTPEEWDAIVTQFGQAELVGQFGQKDPLLRQFMTAAQILEQQAGPKPLSSAGKTQADIDAGLLPEGTPLRGKGTTVNVNTGDTGSQLPIVDKPPKGFQRRWDAGRGTYVDEPIPGGDVETERSDAGRKSDLAQAGYQRKSDIVNSNIDKAMQMLDESGRWVAGFGSMLSGVPESSARDFQAVLDTVKANLGFEELQAMRDASPTGGALGAVTEKEIAFLQAIQGNLDAAQSPAQLRSVLQEIKARRAEFAAERERILSKNQTAAQAAGLQERVRGMPNFQAMSDEDLDAFIRENEQ